MSVYNPSIPQPTDRLSFSQPQLLQNFDKANSSFGIDHYNFADATVNNGKHNQVTTPAYVANPATGLPPVTIANEPKIYAFQDSANLGVINYSRGPSDAVPSPITFLQSTAAAIVLANNATTNVLDFSGLARALCMLYAADLSSPALISVSFICWDGTNLTITKIDSSAINMTIQASPASVLQIKNVSGSTFNNLYWSMQFLRTS